MTFNAHWEHKAATVRTDTQKPQSSWRGNSINFAVGDELDEIGELLDVQRRRDDDEEYRSRLMGGIHIATILNHLELPVLVAMVGYPKPCTKEELLREIEHWFAMDDV